MPYLFSFIRHNPTPSPSPAPVEEEEEVPPAKRRRLGETIFSTALSAALIGTAVGMTAYKLYVVLFFEEIIQLTLSSCS